MSKIFGITLGLGLIIVLTLFMPLLYIWALNTLFGLTIAYTLETWAAAVLLSMFFSNSIKTKGK